MAAPSIGKLPPKHAHFAETRSISLMQAAGTRIPLIERKGYLRSPIRNEVEHSAKKILAECSTRWPSAQYFRSIIQPNYHRAVHVVNGKLTEGWTNFALKGGNLH